MTSSVYRAIQLSAAVVAALATPIALGVLTAQASSLFATAELSSMQMTTVVIAPRWK
jgi:formate dehydrogenase assembly factor FdhD